MNFSLSNFAQEKNRKPNDDKYFVCDSELDYSKYQKQTNMFLGTNTNFLFRE